MNYFLKKISTFTIMFLCTVCAHAQTDIDYNETLINQQIISIKKIESQSALNISPDSLEKNVQNLKQIQDFANGCIANKDNILNNTKSLQNYTASVLLQETQTYNDEMLSKLNQQRAACILLENQATNDVNLLLSKLNQLNASEKNPNIIQILSTPSIENLPIELLSMEHFLNLNTLTEVEISVCVYVFLISFIVAIMLSLKCYKSAKKYPKKPQKYLFYQLAIYLPILVPLITTFFYLYILIGQVPNPPIIVDSLLLVIGLILLRFSLRFYLDIVHMRMSRNWRANILRAFAIIFYGILFIYFGKQALLHLVQQNLLVALVIEIWQFLTNLFFIFAWLHLLNAIVDCKFLPISKHQKIYYLKTILTICIISVFLFRAVLALNGYTEYVLNFNLKIILTCLLFISLLNWNSLLKTCESYLQNNKTKLGEKFHLLLGLKSSSHINEITIIRICILILSAFILIKWLLEFLDFDVDIQLIYISFIYSGFYLGNMKIIPVHIIYAMMVFCLVMLTGKAVTNTISSRPIFAQNVDRRHTINKLMNYFFYVLATISSVIVLGFNFQQICILLGALTIGFGVALQSVILDFISGLILIVSKQVHIEDYISIKFVSTIVTTNGYVQKINLLNTQMVSDQGTIINVPNSQLLKNILGNNSLATKTKKCYLTFHITNSQDIDKTKNIIQLVVSKNKNIIQKTLQKPTVSFENQGFLQNKDIYIISLKIYLRSISKKMMIIQELKESIYQELAKNNVSYLKEE